MGNTKNPGIFPTLNIRSSVRLLADDYVLNRNIKSPIDSQILQDDLNSLAEWETDWQMEFNVAKCHSMRVTQHLPDKHILFDYTLHQQKLSKYLGITITDRHVKFLEKKKCGKSHND